MEALRMMARVDAAGTAFLDRLRELNGRMSRAERQVGGGKRLEVPSDAPDSVSSLMSAKSELARLGQTLANLGRFKTEVDAAEGTLQQAVALFDRVRTLGMTGASSIQTELTRKGIADEIGSLLERMAGLANTQVDGRFIFSGDGDQTASFQMDLTQTPPWSSYRGLAASRQAIHPTGVTFRVSLDAGTIFDNADPALNVFTAIEDLRQALLNNDEPAMKAALASEGEVAAHLNSMLTFYGNVQSQIQEAVQTGNGMKLRLRTQVSGLEDADLTEAIVELQQVRFTQQAALEVRSKAPRSSLFDYLG
jgi:flagellar hook-associated protein 3 FlgL